MKSVMVYYTKIDLELKKKKKTRKNLPSNLLQQ